MTPGLRKICARAALCALLLTAATKSAKANNLPTSTDVAWIGVAIGAIGAGIGIAIYVAVHHSKHTLTGCASSAASGLQLQNEGDQQTYALIGEVSGIKSGDRIRVNGKKEKANAGAPRQFLVEKLGKDFGACRVH